jgi:hypothetical protein
MTQNHINQGIYILQNCKSQQLDLTPHHYQFRQSRMISSMGYSHGSFVLSLKCKFFCRSFFSWQNALFEAVLLYATLENLADPR